MGSVSQGLVRFLYSLLIGRFVGVAALGTANAAISVALLLSLLWPTSAGQGATRYVAQMRGAGRPDQAQAVANYLGSRMLASSALLILGSVGICLWTLHTDLGTALSAGLLLLGYSVWSFARGVQYGAGQIARAALWDVASSAFSILALVLVLFLGWNAVLLVPLALSYGIYGLVCWPRRAAVAVDRSLVSDMNRFVAYGVLGTLSSTGLLQLSMISAHMIGSQVDAGMYAAALSLATPATMLARTLSQILFPAMAEAGGRGDNNSIRRQTDLVTRGLVVTMIPVFGALSLASPLILNILYGGQYGPAQKLLPLLLIAVMFTTLPVACVNRLNSMGIAGARFVSATAAGGLILSAALWVLLSPTLGVTGIAVGYLVSTMLTASLAMWKCWRLDGQRWAGLTLRSLLGMTVLVLGILVTQASSVPMWTGPLYSCGFALIWSVICYKDIKALRLVRRKRP
ncbi:lipopolysaccharide biosynthesis protein [Arthrobacter sp. Soil763]|uniref:lipopolysaccharide biosynthesis protein n=1 Tax=Arthrobacter sp. Soil763 TaxID=1736402 RepID=UPI00138EE452|nr:lipopolysaccharide biosynthesis protein [Arthrobacter sp. Soil763]